MVERVGARSVILVGHSMGGPVSLLVAARMPERALHDADLVYTEELLAPILGAFEADFRGALEGFTRRTFPPGTDPAIVEQVVAGLEGVDPEVAMGLVRSYPAFSTARALADCPVPVRCINAATPNETRLAVNRRYGSFDAVLMEGVGHFPMIERPAEFNALLRREIAALQGEGEGAGEGE